ncbi:MAG: phosphotransferase [Actinomycetota bacterium]
MTKDGRFKKVVRRRAAETGQRYTDALADVEGVGDRLEHRPEPGRVLEHLQTHHGGESTAITKASQHNDHVYRVERAGGPAWIARVYPPSRPRRGSEGDAAILRFLERHGYPAERPAVEDPVSDLDGSSVLVTEFLDGTPLPDGLEKIAMIGDLLGRLHALEPDETVDRPGGAAGDDARREGGPAQDASAALAFLESVDTTIVGAARPRFDALRAQVVDVDVGDGLPKSLVHGNLLHHPDHAVLTASGPVAINWKSAGRGPRLADLAYLLWGAEWGDGDGVAVALAAYRRHVEPTPAEIERLAAVMRLRPLYLTCFDLRRAVEAGEQPTGDEWWWGMIDPDHIERNASAARAALDR